MTISINKAPGSVAAETFQIAQDIATKSDGKEQKADGQRADGKAVPQRGDIKGDPKALSKDEAAKLEAEKAKSPGNASAESATVAQGSVAQGGSSRGISALTTSDALITADQKSLLAELAKSVSVQGAAPTDGTSAALLHAFAPLKELLGDPKKFDLGLAELREHLVANANLDVPVSFSALQSLQTLSSSFGVSPATTQPAAAGATPTPAPTATRGEKLADTQKRYTALVEKFFTKLAEGQQGAHLQQMQGALPHVWMRSIQQNLPQLRAAFAPMMKLIGAKPDGKNDSDIEIPGEMVIKAETALEGIVKDTSELGVELKKVKADPKAFAELQAAMRQVREQGHLEGVSPKTARLVTDLLPHAAAERMGSNRATAQRMEAGPTIGASSLENFDFETADISSLIYVVMMMTAKESEDELRDVMGELKKNVALKKEQREKIQKMKENESRLNTEMRLEFSDLQSGGLVDPSVSFDDWKPLRAVQYAEDGRAQLKKPLPPIPAHMTPEGVAAERAKAQGGGGVVGGSVPSVPGVTPLTPAQAKMYAEKYGISDTDIQYMWAHFQTTPNIETIAQGAKNKRDFDAFLRGGGSMLGKSFLGRPQSDNNVVNGPQLKPVGSPPDAKIVAENAANMEVFVASFGRTPEPVLHNSNKTKGGEPNPADSYTITAPLAYPSCSPMNLAPQGQQKNPVTLSRYPTASEVKNMSNAEIKTLWDAILPTLPDPKPTSFDDFMKTFESWAMGCYKGNTIKETQAMNALFAGLSGSDPVLFGLAMEMNKRGCAELYAGAQKIVEHANGQDGAWEDWAGTNSTFRQRSTVTGVVYPGAEYAVNGLGEFACGKFGGRIDAGGSAEGWRAPLLDRQGAGKGDPTKGETAPFQTYDAAMSKLDALNKNKPAPTPKKGEDKTPEPTQQDKDAYEKNKEKYAFGQAFVAAHGIASDEMEQAKLDAADKANGETKQKQSKEELLAEINAGGDHHVDLDDNGVDASGKAWRQGSMEQFAAAVEGEQGKLDNYNDLSEPMQMRLQMYMDRRSKAFEMLSNIMKKIAQTGDSLSQNHK